MKKFIREYSDYNLWANQRIGEVIVAVEDEKLNWNIVSSFPSIWLTTLHIWDAQVIWLERLNGRNPKAWPSANFKGNKREMVEGLVTTSLLLKQIAFTAGKKNLKEEVSYSNMQGKQFRSQVYQALVHLFNHNSYHRGQLTTLLRQAGVTRLPPNDLIFYYRQRDRM